MSKITYFEGIYYLFSNFSAHEVVYQGKKYKSVEHYYQSQKFTDPKIKKEIENAPSPYMAKKISHMHDDKKVSNWEKIKVDVMKKIITQKVKQHEDVREMLIKTGDSEIIDNTPFDYFWGVGKDGSGKNINGKILMEIRSAIKS